MATINIFETAEMINISRMNRAIEYKRKVLLLENERLQSKIQQNSEALRLLATEYSTNTIKYITAKSHATK